jgi:hypothetical protein
MTQTTTLVVPVVKVNTDSVMAGDVFYGTFDTTIKGKRTTVNVCNHLKDIDKTYEFRIAGKCRAGFINIHDTKGTPQSVLRTETKNRDSNYTEFEGKGMFLGDVRAQFGLVSFAEVQELLKDLTNKTTLRPFCKRNAHLQIYGLFRRTPECRHRTTLSYLLQKTCTDNFYYVKINYF